MKALAIAATGMNAQQTNLEVIANNIANINTTGSSVRARNSRTCFTRSTGCRASPTGPTASCRKAPDRPRRQDDGGPQPAHPGRADHDRQPFRPRAERPRLVPDRGADGETLYTRAGSFNTNATGQLVTVDGYAVIPAITVPPNDRGHRQQDRPGLCAHRRPDRPAGSRPAEARQFRQRSRPGAARRQLFQETAASGAANVGVPGDRLRHHPAGLSRKLQRRSGQGNHRADLGAARLRDELQGHPGRRRNGRTVSKGMR